MGIVLFIFIYKIEGKTVIQYKATFTHIDDNAFHWLININGETFEYRTGLGHGVQVYDKWGQLCPYKLSKLKKDNPDAQYIRIDNDWFAKVPKLDEVLYCLFSDADAGDMSFYDFCDNFGYDRDSINALNTHMACMKNSEKLRKALKDQYYTERTRIEELNQ